VYSIPEGWGDDGVPKKGFMQRVMSIAVLEELSRSQFVHVKLYRGRRLFQLSSYFQVA